MIRVLFVIGSLGGGGAERQLLEILQHLDRSRFAPSLYLAYRRGELLSEVPADVPIMAFDDGKTRRHWTQRLLAKLRCPSAARAAHIREVLRRQPVDLVFAWGLRTAYETALPARLSRVRRIAYCCVEPETERDIEFPRGTLGRVQRARWAYASADCVFANAEQLRQRLIDFYRIPREKSATCYNLRDFSRVESLAREYTPSWPSSGFKLLSVGRLDAQKGQSLLLDAMAHLVHQQGRNVQAVLVGQGPDEQTLKRQVEELNLRDRVAFAGFVPNPAPYYRHADLFVFPSYFEGMPNVLIEAVACGVPVLATDCPCGPSEILAAGRVGHLIPVGDVAALTAGIAECMDHDDDWQGLTTAARQRVRQMFDVQAGVVWLQAALDAVCRGEALPEDDRVQPS